MGALEGRLEVMVAYIATTLSVVLGLPLYIRGTRDVAESIWVRDVAPMLGCGGKDGKDGKDGTALRNTFTVATMFLTLAIAISVTDLGLTVALNGAVCASLMMYVFPALMYIKCSNYRPDDSSGLWWKHRGLPITVIVIGVGMGIAGVTTTLMLSED